MKLIFFAPNQRRLIDSKTASSFFFTPGMFGSSRLHLDDFQLETESDQSDRIFFCNVVVSSTSMLWTKKNLTLKSWQKMNCFLATSLTDKISTCIFGACQSLVSWNLGAVVTVAKWLELLTYNWRVVGIMAPTFSRIPVVQWSVIMSKPAGKWTGCTKMGLAIFLWT